jgi:hypothetical protein
MSSGTFSTPPRSAMSLVNSAWRWTRWSSMNRPASSCSSGVPSSFAVRTRTGPFAVRMRLLSLWYWSSGSERCVLASALPTPRALRGRRARSASISGGTRGEFPLVRGQERRRAAPADYESCAHEGATAVVPYPSGIASPEVGFRLAGRARDSRAHGDT